MMPETCYIKEKSWIARIAAKKLGQKQVAMVFRKTIHLHNTKREDFLKDTRWLCHELTHIKQYRQHGTMGFLWKYLWESIRNGYHNNRFEKEAREGETNLHIMSEYNII